MSRASKSAADWERRIEAARRLHQEAQSQYERGRTMPAYRKVAKAVAVWRAHLADQPNSVPVREGLAEALSLIAAIAAKRGRREEALKSAHEAAATYGTLAREDKQAFWPHEAKSLQNLGCHLSVLGRHEEAREVTARALHICRLHVGEKRPFYEAEALNSLSLRLTALGEFRDSEESMLLSTSMLHRENPQRFLKDEPRSLGVLRRIDMTRREHALKEAEMRLLELEQFGDRYNLFHWFDQAVCLNKTGIYLGELGRCEEALKAAQKAVATVRRIENNPYLIGGDTRHVLARCLSILGIRLSDVGRLGEAEKCLKEAYDIRVTLARENPKTFLCNESMWLNGFGIRDSSLGRSEEALDSANDAVRIFRRLSSRNPSAFGPYWARSLTRRGYWLHKLGRHGEGLRAARNALRVYRHLASPLPQEFRSEQAKALNNLGVQLGDLGLHEAALENLNESMEIYRELDGKYSPEIQHCLAKCTSNVAFCLGNLGRKEEALKAANEALRIHQGRGQEDQKTVESELEIAKCVHNVGVSLCDLRRYEESLEYSENALSIYRRQYVNNDNIKEIDISIARCLTNRGYCMGAIGRPLEALSAIEESVRIYERWDMRPEPGKVLL